MIGDDDTVQSQINSSLCITLACYAFEYELQAIHVTDRFFSLDDLRKFVHEQTKLFQI